MLGLADYLDFLRRNPSLAAFGFITAFGSSFGQTFFIGVLSPTIQTEFSLSHTEWGSIYLLGTLASALVLPWTGKQIDRIALRTYALLVWLTYLGWSTWLSMGESTVASRVLEPHPVGSYMAQIVLGMLVGW